MGEGGARRGSGIGRRRWLRGVAAAAVVAFDPVRRVWIRGAEAAAHEAPEWVGVPPLDGELTFDAAALDAAADDFGHIVHERPRAVLRPGSVRDVRRMVRFANRQRLGVAMRGQGHSTHGQSQVEAGIVIDSRTLASIGEVGDGRVSVGPGALWVDVLRATLAAGQTPPVFTDFLELSVGGTLANGGIGGATVRHGLQVDNVLELEVVTGRGRLVRCSPERRRGLFEAVLGGLGQVGIIVRATLRLEPAPARARVFRLFYSDLAVFLRDERALAESERFSYLEGQALAQPEGGFLFMLEAASYFTPPEQPDDAALLSGLEPLPGLTQIEEPAYFDWINRLEALFAELRASGGFAVPHPWFDVFLPADEAPSYLAEVFAALTPADTGGGPILVYPFKRAKVTRPLVAMPSSEVVFLFDILRFAPPEPAVVSAMLAQNLELFERARSLGAKKYPIGSIPLDMAGWAEHFGAELWRLVAAKARFDPNRVLTPGQKIFPPPGP